MEKGVYFIEPNQNLVSDFDGFFLLNPQYNLVGSSGILATAVNEIKGNPAVDVVIMAQNMVDGDCVSALQQLSAKQALKIVGLDAPNEVLQSKISSLGGISIIKPYTFAEIDALLSSNVQNKATVPEPQTQTKTAPQMPEQTTVQIPQTQEINDNPYITQAARAQSGPSAPDVKEKLRQVRRDRAAEPTQRLLPQQVIAVHNQKGGVGKTTLAKELAVAIHRFGLVKGGETRHPKVCLCDFDLDASDVVSVLNLPPRPNIFDWHTDLHNEAQRIQVANGKTEPIQSIRFTERQIMENYLVRHESGIYVLAAPETKQESTEIHKEDIQAIIANLRACSFDIIILDTGPNILDYTLASLLEADTILAVSTCEIVSVRRLHSIIRDLVRVPGFNPSKIKLVVNAYDPESNVLPQEIASVLSLEMIGVIPKYDEIGNINNESYSVFFNRSSKDKRAAQAYAECINRLGKKLLHLDEIPTRNQKPQYEPERPKHSSFWHRLFG